ncbi:arginine repressor [Egicoccus halophilus]|uniref:Arginine repressor n=1 Tax=Egicoccus halophilus TaxID=1670830 RepID=A0A8J3AG70_9ACTN|nr:arginine repressor [Egicoccus halophilus]GGI07506.1 arginine repressor [Egicoccus halophilus]
MADKRRRQQLLRELITSTDLGSQAEVRAALADRGLDAHQATVSRDLDELGAIKVRGADGALVYRLAVDPGPGSARGRLDETLRQFVVSVASSGNLAVLRTPPACAHPVASAIDLAELDGVLATVSGDDTVLVVAAETLPGTELAAQLRRRAGLTPTGEHSPA